MYQETTATRKIFALEKRIRAVCGGTSASKTVSILIYLIDYAISKDNTSISVVSESFPHLKRGAIRDFTEIMKEHGYWHENMWNATDKIFNFPNGSFIEFFSVDQPDKVRGPRRDILFINECNNIPYEAFDQLEIRTKNQIWLDWNPTNEFWFYDKVKQRPDVDFITLTYKDNEGLDRAIVESIESHKDNKNWWKVYGLGQLGEVEGKIYSNWAFIDEIPHEAKLERYGLDFGFSVDPTAIVAIYYYEGGYIVDEIAYQKGLSNKQISDILLSVDKSIVIADSADPKSIDEIKTYGITILPSIKGKDSVRRGISHVQSQRISVTNRSINVIKEYRNYMWMKAKDGNLVSPNEPEGIWNHTMDAIRYAMENIKPVYKPPKPLEPHEKILNQIQRNHVYDDDVLGNYF